MLIAPSILAANLCCLGSEATAVLDAGADRLHFDVMDNHYIENLSFGPDLCQSLRDFGITAPIDVHLMASPVESLIDKFARIGVESISFHPDATTDIHQIIAMIQSYDIKAGIAISPDVPVVPNILEKIDLLLIMSVTPGKSGQKFIGKVMDKIISTRLLLNSIKKPITLVVDGGVNADNVVDIESAGADIVVVGSYLFNSNDYSAAISTLKKQIS